MFHHARPFQGATPTIVDNKSNVQAPKLKSSLFIPFMEINISMCMVQAWFHFIKVSGVFHAPFGAYSLNMNLKTKEHHSYTYQAFVRQIDLKVAVISIKTVWHIPFKINIILKCFFYNILAEKRNCAFHKAGL